MTWWSARCQAGRAGGLSEPVASVRAPSVALDGACRPAALDRDRHRQVRPQRDDALRRSSKSTSSPPIATILSPGLRPASAAGEPARPLRRHWALRRADDREKRRENQDRQKEIRAGPASTTRKRCHTGRSWNARSRDSGGMRFVAGLARRAHVADELHIAAERQPADLPPRSLPVGPADDLAAEADRKGLRRDPEKSCDEIMAKLVEEDERPKRADESDEDQPERRLRKHQALAFMMASTSGGSRGRSRSRRRSMPGASKLGSAERLGDRCDDIGEADSAGKEARDRDFIRGVQHDRRRAARLERLAGKPERRKARTSGTSKSSLAIAARSSRCAGRRDPFGPGQRVGDRDPHVGRAELGKHRSVDELDHRMDHRLRDGSGCRSGRTAGRTDNGPRSARAPCSSGSPNSTEILAPIDQLGWATAWAGVADRIVVGGRGPERPSARGQDDL